MFFFYWDTTTQSSLQTRSVKLSFVIKVISTSTNTYKPLMFTYFSVASDRTRFIFPYLVYVSFEPLKCLSRKSFLFQFTLREPMFFFLPRLDLWISLIFNVFTLLRNDVIFSNTVSEKVVRSSLETISSSRTQDYLELKEKFEIRILTVCKIKNNSAFQLLKVSRKEKLHRITKLILKKLNSVMFTKKQVFGKSCKMLLKKMIF